MPTFLNNQINPSPTRYTKAGAAIEDVRFKAVKFDENGNTVLATAGTDVILGIAIATTGNANGKVAVGDQVDVQIKECGYAMAGGKIAVGSPVAAGADGKLVTAASGNFVLGYAITAASADGDIFEIQIAKGYCPTAS